MQIQSEHNAVGIDVCLVIGEIHVLVVTLDATN